ncbi:MAG TPA: type VI secretion system baseplate subunit TssE [Telluria sp.]|jgi:type VI secretion system lysozyme-like protein
MASKLAAARLPLLERLGQRGHGRALDPAALRDSVGRELLRLLNTRRSGHASALGIVDYGLPDWSSSYSADVDDRQQLARGIEAAVRAFEPRLRAPRVEVLPDPAGMRRLQVHLSGSLWIDEAAWAVSYGLGLDGSGATLLGGAASA